MIEKSYIEKLVNEHCSQESIFPVEINVSTSNRITVLVDSKEGVRIDQCVALSRHIEGNLDREVEDFELEVSSAGLDQALKILPQYEKNVGRNVVVKMPDGSKIKGLLESCDAEGFAVKTERKEKIEGKKKKQVIIETINLKYTDIHSTKVEISF